MANLGKKSKGKNKKKKGEPIKNDGEKALQDKIKQMEQGDYQKRLASAAKKELKVRANVRGCGAEERAWSRSSRPPLPSTRIVQRLRGVWWLRGGSVACSGRAGMLRLTTAATPCRAINVTRHAAGATSARAKVRGVEPAEDPEHVAQDHAPGEGRVAAQGHRGHLAEPRA